jgi:hypothetical protein
MSLYFCNLSLYGPEDEGSRADKRGRIEEECGGLRHVPRAATHDGDVNAQYRSNK